MSIVNSVDFNEILQQHKDDIGEQSSLLAEVDVLELVEDLRGKALKVLVMLQYLVGLQIAHFF